MLGLLWRLMAVAPAGAANTVTYQDSTGEPGVKDITTIVISNNDTGMITIRINIPSLPTYTVDIHVDIFSTRTTTRQLVDRHPGRDYVIELFQGEVKLFKWDGTDFTRRVGDPPATTLIYYWANGVTISISAAELGNTKSLRVLFAVIAGIVFDAMTGEPDFANAVGRLRAGHGRGFYTYDVKVAPARVVFKSLKKAPASPKAGKTFTVRMAATRSDTGAAIVNGRVDCARRQARGASSRSRRGSWAARRSCVFTVPANGGQDAARDDQDGLRGQALTRPFSAKIR